jgi:hypothetical protein
MNVKANLDRMAEKAKCRCSVPCISTSRIAVFVKNYRHFYYWDDICGEESSCCLSVLLIFSTCPCHLTYIQDSDKHLDRERNDHPKKFLFESSLVSTCKFVKFDTLRHWQPIRWVLFADIWWSNGYLVREAIVWCFFTIRCMTCMPRYRSWCSNSCTCRYGIIRFGNEIDVIRKLKVNCSRC